MTPEHARTRAKDMRALAVAMRQQAANELVSGDLRYKAAVQADHADELAREFDKRGNAHEAGSGTGL